MSEYKVNRHLVLQKLAVASLIAILIGLVLASLSGTAVSRSPDNVRTTLAMLRIVVLVAYAGVIVWMFSSLVRLLLRPIGLRLDERGVHDFTSKLGFADWNSIRDVQVRERAGLPQLRVRLATAEDWSRSEILLGLLENWEHALAAIRCKTDPGSNNAAESS
jgi:hypothetical protein